MHNDPLRHPDLTRLGRRMREHYTEVLEAEEAAARDTRNRQRTLRDRFLEAQDREEAALIHGTDAQVYRGTVVSVGTDHVTLADSGHELLIAIEHILGVEFR